jgi:hypothetical protein
MKLRTLVVAAALLCAPALAGRKGEPATVIGDQVSYTRGQWLAFNSPWSIFSPPQNAYVHGVDYFDTTVIRPSSFPSGATVNWFWPATPCTSVCGYMQLTYGNYDGGQPQAPVTSRQVKNIVTLNEEFDYSLTGNPASFNVLNEFYLTSTQGDETTRVLEVGWFLNASTSGAAFFNSSTQLGTFTDQSGQVWKAAFNASGEANAYVMIMPNSGAQILRGTIDMKAALTFLTSNGRITGNEWLNGLALGVEPVSGSGSMKVARWTIVYN